MRRLAITLIFAGLSCPTLAVAGTANTTFTTSTEKGVTIYRGQSSAHNHRVMTAIQQGYELRETQAKINARLDVQQRQIKAQSRDIAALQAREAKAAAKAKPKRRGRFGRTYAGNNRFFGANGFIGNSNFSGATQPLPRRPRPRVRPKKP